MALAGIQVGTMLGRYEVIKHLARGGMADLSVARTRGIEGFERHVVVKTLRAPQSDDAAFVKMFVTEARLAGALHHHNIVQVHDIGEDRGRYFIAMEYVHGEDLRRVLSELYKRGEQPPLEHVVGIIATVASALHHAHEHRSADGKPLGIVHRDVTPGNILVGFDGNIKVVDFGIAKAALGTTDTQTGMLKGKVPYMSPEQCTGRPIDRRSDLFSLGIVLYELTTVRRLFRGGNEFHTMSAVVRGDIPPPSQYRPELPRALEAIILRALARKPSERFQTGDELRRALEQFADDARLRVSVSGLEAYMKRLFGDRPQPWMQDLAPPASGIDDFDTEPGIASVPTDALEHRAIPRSVATTRGSLIEQARLDAIASELPMGRKPIPSLVGKPGRGEPKAPASRPAGTPPAVRPIAPQPTMRVAPLPPPVTLPRPPDAFDRATTDIDATAVDVQTDLSAPPPPPRPSEPQLAAPAVTSSQIIEAATPPRDPTAIVTPLPMPVPAVTEEIVAQRAMSRAWLLAGGLAIAAVAVAIAIVLTGSKPIVSDEPIDLGKPVVVAPPPAPPAPEIVPATAEPEAAVAAQPVTAPEPAPDTPANAATAATEPALATTTAISAEPEPEPEPDPEPATQPAPAPAPTVAAKPTPARPRPKITKRRPVRATTRRARPARSTTKPKPKPSWDPDALFLNKKP